MHRRRLFLLAAGAAAAARPPAGAADELAPLDRLRRGGLVVLMRHARAPGTGDPPGFRLDDCATQRNLDEAGRAEARAAGDWLRAQGVPVGRVLTSQWCRARDTARLLGHGEPDHLPALDSFFEDRSLAASARAGILAFARAWPGPGNAILVTHQVNITAVTDVFPRSGEMVLVEPTGRVVGRLTPA